MQKATFLADENEMYIQINGIKLFVIIDQRVSYGVFSRVMLTRKSIHKKKEFFLVLQLRTYIDIGSIAGVACDNPWMTIWFTKN